MNTLSQRSTLLWGVGGGLWDTGILLEDSPDFYEIFVVDPHTVVSTVIVKEKETAAIVIMIINSYNDCCI